MTPEEPELTAGQDDTEDEFQRGGGEQVWKAIGRAPASTAPRDVLTDLYGTGPRGGLNTAAARADLGVSESTIRRWAKHGIPDNQNGSQVRDKHVEHNASPEVREAKMNPRREARIRKNGMTVKFKGKIRISKTVRDYSTRELELALSPDQAASILDALLAGNDAAAHEALEDAFGDAGFGGSISMAIESLGTKV